MSLYAQLLISDKKFYQMLRYELNGLGIEILGKVNSNQNKIAYVIADLDTCKTDDLKNISGPTVLIGFSNSESGELEDSKQRCAYYLHRPFLMSDFRKIFDGSDIKTLKKSSENRSSTSSVNLRSARLEIDEKNHSAVFGDEIFPLSEYEFSVLSRLISRRGEVVSREEIQKLLGFSEGNMGDVYICHLRRKIDNKLGLKLIYTVRGKGYMLK